MEDPYPSHELTAMLRELTRITQAWALGQRVDFERLRELRRQAILANHAYYMETIPIYGRITPDEFDILDHRLSRLVVVRPVEELSEVLAYLHAGVSTAGVYPESRRMALRDQIAARGVSNVLPPGQCERIVPGAPHDGMMVLSELVDWKTA